MANQRWKHDPNPWKPLLLIPNDVGLGPIFTDWRGKRWMNTKNAVNTKNTEGKTGEIRGQNTKDI